MEELERLIKRTDFTDWLRKLVRRDGGAKDEMDALLYYAVKTVMRQLDEGVVIRDMEPYVKEIIRKRWRREDEQRKRRATVEPADWMPGLSHDPGRARDLRELAERLLTIIQQLDEPCRTILYLSYYERLSDKDIQARGHFADQDVRDLLTWLKGRRHDCKKKLWQRLKDDPDFSDYLKKIK